MSDYTSRELDIMYREAFEAGQEQGRVDMARIVAERDYLRHALREAIEEIESVVNLANMSPPKARRHRKWMAWLKLALPKDNRCSKGDS